MAIDNTNQSYFADPRLDPLKTEEEEQKLSVLQPINAPSGDSPLADKKRKTLSFSTQEKRDNLTPAVVTDIPDADSLVLNNNPQETRMLGFDAYEVRHDMESPEMKAYVESGGYDRKMQRQREHLAKQRGVDPSMVTNEDVFAEGEKQRVRMAAELATGKPFEEDFQLYGDYTNKNRVDFSGTNQEVLVDKQGVGAFGRDLVNVQQGDYDINNRWSQDESLNAEDPRYKTGYNPNLARVEAEIEANNIVPGGAGNIISGLGSTIIKDMGYAADALTDSSAFIAEKIMTKALGDEGYQKRLNSADTQKYLSMFGMEVDKNGQLNHRTFEPDEKAINELTGYNPDPFQQASARYNKGMDKIWTDDNLTIAQKIKKTVPWMVKNAEVAPEAIAQSILFVAEMSNPYTATARIIGETGHTLDERKILNKGRRATAIETLSVGAMNAANLFLDSTIDKAMFGIGKAGKIFHGPILKMIDAATPDVGKTLTAQILKSISKGIAKTGTAATAAAIVEPTTEMIQEVMSIYAEKYGTDPFKDKELLALMDEKDLRRMRDAGYMGLIAGVGQATGGSAVQQSIAIAEPVVDTLAKDFTQATEPFNETEFKESVNPTLVQMIQSNETKLDKEATRQAQALAENIDQNIDNLESEKEQEEMLVNLLKANEKFGFISDEGVSNINGKLASVVDFDAMIEADEGMVIKENIQNALNTLFDGALEDIKEQVDSNKVVTQSAQSLIDGFIKREPILDALMTDPRSVRVLESFSKRATKLTKGSMDTTELNNNINRLKAEYVLSKYTSSEKASEAQRPQEASQAETTTQQGVKANENTSIKEDKTTNVKTTTKDTKSKVQSAEEQKAVRESERVYAKAQSEKVSIDKDTGLETKSLGSGTDVSAKQDADANAEFRGSINQTLHVKQKNRPKTKRFETLLDNKTVQRWVNGIFTSDEKKELSSDDKSKRRAMSKLVPFTKTSNELKTFLSKLKKAKDQLKKDLDTTKSSKIFDSIFNGTDEENEGMLVRLGSIGISAILADARSNLELANRAGIIEDDFYATANHVYQQIGKEFYESFGYVLTGNPVNVAAEHAYIGQLAVELLQNAGLIDIKAGTSKVSDKIFDIDGNFVTGEKVITQDAFEPGSAEAKVTKIIPANTYAKVGKEYAKQGDIFNDVEQTVKPIMYMLFPTNREQPGLAPTKEIVKTDTGLNKVSEDVIIKKQETPLSIKENSFKVLDFIQKLRASKYAGETYKMIKNEKWIRNLLGLSEQSVSIKRSSILGRNEARIRHLEDMLDLLPFMDRTDPMYYTYKVAQNKRMHLMQTVFEYQGDNFLARHMLTDSTKEYTTSTEEEATFLINELADILDVEPKVITGELKNNESIETLVDPRVDLSNPKTVQAILEDMDSNPVYSIMYAGKSPMQVLGALKAVKDVRKAFENGDGTKITTDFMVGPDANSSGLMNTILNLVGRFPGLRSKLVNIGIMKTDEEGSLTLGDGYTLISNEVERLLGEETGIPGQPGSARVKARTVLAVLNSLGIKTRDMAKAPVMRNLYGQTTEVMKTQLGQYILDEIIDKSMQKNDVGTKAKAELTSQLEKIGSKHNVYAMSKEEYAAIAKEYGNTLGSFYAEALNAQFADINSFRSALEKAYKVLSRAKSYTMSKKVEGISYDSIELRDPMDLWDEMFGRGLKPTDKHSFPVEKLKNTKLAPFKGDKSVSLLKQIFVQNPNSIKVNPQHAIDATVLEVAYKKTIESYGSERLPASMDVHDAVYSNPEFAMRFIKNYNEAAKEVAQAYDIVAETIYQLDRVIDMVDDSNNESLNALKREALEQKEDLSSLGSTDDIKMSSDKAIKDKIDYINSLDNLVVFGTQLEGPYDFKSFQEGDNSFETKKGSEEALNESREAKQNEEILTEQKKQLDGIRSYRFANAILNALQNENPFDTESSPVEVIENLKAGLSQKDLNTYGRQLEIIQGFLEGNNKLEPSDSSYYTLGSDTVYFQDRRVGNIHNYDQYTGEQLIETMAHEIMHFNTANYIFSKEGKASGEVKFLERVMYRLDNASLRNVDQNVAARISYIRNQKEIGDRVAEFVAIMMSEPEMAKGISEVLFGNKEASTVERVMNVIKRLIEKTLKWLTPGEVVDFNSRKPIQFKNTIAALTVLQHNAEVATYEAAYNKTLHSGMDIKDIDLGKLYSYTPYKGNKAAVSGPISSSIMRMNMALGMMIRSGVIAPVNLFFETKAVKGAHKYAKKNSQMYRDTLTLLEKLNTDGGFADRMKAYLGVKEGIDYLRQSKVITDSITAEQHKKTIVTQMLAETSKLIPKKIRNDKKKLAVLDQTFAHAGIGSIAAIGELDNIATGSKTVDDVITMVESVLRDPEMRDYALELATAQMTGVVGKSASVANYKYLVAKDLKFFDALVSLYSLKMDKEYVAALQETKKDSPKLYKKLVELSVQTKAVRDLVTVGDIFQQTEGVIRHDVRGNGIHDHFERSYDFKLVLEKELAMGLYPEEEGWIEIRKPDASKGIIGIKARLREDYGKRQGAIYIPSIETDGLYVTKEIARELTSSTKLQENNIIYDGSRGDGYRVVLTNKEKQALGWVQDPVQNLYRSYASNAEIAESESMANEIVRYDTYLAYTDSDIDNLAKEIEKGKKDYKAFISLPNGYNRNELPAIIKQKYHILERGEVPNVHGLSRTLHLVRKDQKDTLIGYRNDNIFDPANKKLRMVEGWIRDLVTMFKIHVVLANQAKIAMDMASNVSIMLAKDIPFTSMAKYGREALDLQSSMAKLRDKLVMANMELLSYEPGSKDFERQRAKIEKIKTRINDHKFAPALKNGFIQSMATHLMIKDQDSISGLNHRIDDILDGLKDYKGAQKMIMSFAKYGPGVENVLGAFIKLSAIKKDGDVAKELKRVAKHFETLKKEDDYKAYIHEILASPKSELVKFGVTLTLAADTVSRWIVYKHNKDLGLTEQQATEDALATFVDYRQNLPKEVQLASDYGVLLFPTFWLKIQRVILGLALERPASTAMTVGTGALIGSAESTIFGSNLFTKFSGYSPVQFDTFADPNAIVPMEFWDNTAGMVNLFD